MKIEIIIDDRIVHALSRIFSRRAAWSAAALAIVAPLALTAADDPPFGMHAFEPHQIISSAEMNDNFIALGQHAARFEDALTVSEAGQVGIGTDTPMAPLQVQAINNPVVFTGAAHTAFATEALDDLPLSSLVVGGPWAGYLYFYFKDATGAKYKVVLKGEAL